MIYANHLSPASDEVGKDMRKVAGAGANVENSGAWGEEGKQRLARRSVHMRRRDRSQKPDPLRRVFVREGRGVVCPIDLMEVSVPFDKCCARRITPSMAFLTLSVMIRPFPARLAISAALLAPEDRQAMAADEPVLTELAARRVRKLPCVEPNRRKWWDSYL